MDLFKSMETIWFEGTEVVCYLCGFEQLHVVIPRRCVWAFFTESHQALRVLAETGCMQNENHPERVNTRCGFIDTLTGFYRSIAQQGAICRLKAEKTLNFLDMFRSHCKRCFLTRHHHILERFRRCQYTPSAQITFANATVQLKKEKKTACRESILKVNSFASRV